MLRVARNVAPCDLEPKLWCPLKNGFGLKPKPAAAFAEVGPAVCVYFS